MTNADSHLSSLTEGVEAGALAVAMARRMEADSPCPLFTDPYAAPLIDAAVAHGAALPTGEAAERIRAMSGYTASRTKWFDEFLIAACAYGVEQAVIVAAGFDAQGWRLPWTSRSAVYEIDQRAVLAVKAEALRGDEPAVPRYVAVPVDAWDEWPKALLLAGFDAAEPTAWAVEGLLPAVAEGPHALFERIHELSAVGSRIAVEAVGPGIGARLIGHGWEITSVEAAHIARRYGRCGHDEPGLTVPDTVFIDGKLPLTPTTGIPPTL
jgi:methyltransferase (TIGR00027 family)